MVAAIDRPYANSNFRVDLGTGDSRGRDAGFCEVILPEFRVDGPADVREAAPPGAVSGSDRLILRRGVTGSLDLYDWWNKARRGKAPQRRTVRVELLAPDHGAVVMTWYFRRARPVCLSYSPLNALQGSVLIETVELEFESMEMR